MLDEADVLAELLESRLEPSSTIMIPFLLW